MLQTSLRYTLDIRWHATNSSVTRGGLPGQEKEGATLAARLRKAIIAAEDAEDAAQQVLP